MRDGEEPAPAPTEGDDEVVTIQDTVEQWRDNLALQEFRKSLEGRRVRDVAFRGRMMRMRIIIFVVLVVGFFAGNIAIQAFRFPRHFRFYRERVRDAEVAAEGRHQVSMYHVVVAAYYRPVHVMLNTLGIWRELPRAGAHFLMLALQHFDAHLPRTRGRLTALHWAGAGAQTGAANLFRPGGGWATACVGGSLADRRRELRANWTRSRAEGNIWWPFFPDPETDEAAFFAVGAIQELLTDDTCGDSNISAYANLYTLFDGGLVNVARLLRRKGQSADELLHFMFGVDHVTIPECGQGAQYALRASAATGALASTYIDAVQPITAMHRAAGAKFTAVSMGLSVAASLGAGQIGYMLGQRREEAACDET